MRVRKKCFADPRLKVNQRSLSSSDGKTMRVQAMKIGLGKETYFQ